MIFWQQKILSNDAVGNFGALVIGIGKSKLNDSLPIMARIDDDVSKASKFFSKESKLDRLYKIRDELAKHHGILPTIFMNDRVVMNVHEKAPKNITELWTVDGISDGFVMKYGAEFIDRIFI